MLCPRPLVAFSGYDFQNLISACLSGNGCPGEFKDVPLNCWDVFGVDNMNSTFDYQDNFNDPLRC